MVNYFEALKYPFSDKKNFIIGFLISIFWWLLIPVFFVFGYIVESIRETLQNSTNAPNWFNSENWKRFLNHGLSVTIVGMIYLIPPIVLSLAATAIMGNTSISFLSGELPQFNVMGIVLFVLSIIFFTIAIFVLPIAIILYSASEDIRYAFSISEIIPRIKRVIFPYFNVHLFSLFIFFAIASLMLIPYVNLFFAIIFGGIFFYYLMVSTRLFAGIFRDYGL